jgi:hypothetical protein
MSGIKPVLFRKRTCLLGCKRFDQSDRDRGRLQIGEEGWRHQNQPETDNFNCLSPNQSIFQIYNLKLIKGLLAEKTKKYCLKKVSFNNLKR